MEERNQDLLVVPLALINDILAYLGKKPYEEVAPYINALQANAKLMQKEEIMPAPPAPLEKAEEIKEVEA